jgi:hypothetical protein
LANVVRNKKDIIFNGLGEAKHSEAQWRVLDPVDNTNNLVGSWNNAKINELGRWLENARDEMNRAIRYDEMGDDIESMKSLVKLFGNAFENNSED